jgi:hypothetical protein
LTGDRGHGRVPIERGFRFPHQPQSLQSQPLYVHSGRATTKRKKEDNRRLLWPNGSESGLLKDKRGQGTLSPFVLTLSFIVVDAQVKPVPVALEQFSEVSLLGLVC